MIFKLKPKSTYRTPQQQSSYRHFVLISLLLILTSTPIKAVTTVTVGGAATDEGDDRERPAVYIAGQNADQFFVKSYLYGRTMNRVTERTITLTAGKRFAIFGSSWFKSGFGLTVSDDYTHIDKSENSPAESEHGGNIGAMFNLHFAPPLGNNMTLEAGWDSHVYLAGAAGIFLATGRKQMLYLGTGLTF